MLIYSMALKTCQKFHSYCFKTVWISSIKMSNIAKQAEKDLNSY